jgi:diguanylate cyclase (GGDEF)-like protein
MRAGIPILGEAQCLLFTDDLGVSRAVRAAGVVSSDVVAGAYRQLGDIYHDLLSRDGLDQLLERIVKTVQHLIPMESILVAEAKTAERMLKPLVAEGAWPADFLESQLPFGHGLIGLAAEHGKAILCNDAENDPRAGHVAGTPADEPEAIISLPLVARGVVIGAMSLYREGEGAAFSEFEFELAQRFADAATLALDNTRRREELRELTRRDELTGLNNRRGFGELMSTLLGRQDLSVGVALIDLDDFKGVNDQYGHLVGDELLRQLADRLRGATREGDIVCRLGGDEFAVVISGADEHQVAAVSQRIEAAVRETPFFVGGHRVEQTASVGYACTDAGIATADELLTAADAALYAAKKTTYGRVLKLARST